MIAVTNASLTNRNLRRETSETDPLRRAWKRKSIRGPRSLLQNEDFDVPLFLELQYLNTTTVEQLENYDVESEPILQLCSCVGEQTNGAAATNMAFKKNVSLVVNQESECAVIETSRVYDPEAEDLFGPGYLSLQVQIMQRISIFSEESIDQEDAAEIVASGYDYSTGAQRYFITCLNKYDNFGKVLSVDLRRGLSAQDVAPTSNPSRTSPQPSVKPTLAPTARASAENTAEPTEANVTGVPSVFPTDLPSLRPSSSQTPTTSPTTMWSSGFPSVAAIRVPTMPPTRYDWTTLPTGVTQASPIPDNIIAVTPENDKQTNNVTSNPLVIAAIAGATSAIVVSCIFACCIWWRRRKSIPSRRSKPEHALSGQSSKGDPKDMIPGFVELNQDHISLAETTLGDGTAGGRTQSRSRNTPPKSTGIRSPTSFDEESLYTTPFSVNRDDIASYHQSYNGPSILVSHISRPLQYNGTMLSPFSDSTTTSSDGVSSFDPLSARISTDSSLVESSSTAKSTAISPRTVPIELETQSPYQQNIRSLSASTTRSNDRTRAQVVSQAIDEGSTEYDIDEGKYDIDAWSCDFEEFDRGSEFYELEARSRSPSHSSRSTTKIKNLSSVLKQPNCSSISRARDIETSAEIRPGLKINRPQKQTPSRDKTPESKDYMNPWSVWSSMVLQDGGSKNTETSHIGNDQNKEQRSPFSKLLDSVTQVVSPLHSIHSIPAVTPEETESDIDLAADTSLGKEDDSTLLGLQFRDDISASSNSTSLSAGPWLFEKVEESLGPKSITADMESLSGKSNRSMRSTGNRSKAGAESKASFGSARSHWSTPGFTQNEISFTPKTLEHDLKRLEKQLAALDNDAISTSSAGVSSVTGTSHAKASVSSRSKGGSKVSRKNRIVVVVPPGKLGVILANRHDGKGTVISEVRESSPLFRLLTLGDRLVGVDDDDVTNMVVSQITSLVASRADRERRLTILTSVAHQYSKSSKQ